MRLQRPNGACIAQLLRNNRQNIGHARIGPLYHRRRVGTPRANRVLRQSGILKPGDGASQRSGQIGLGRDAPRQLDCAGAFSLISRLPAMLSWRLMPIAAKRTITARNPMAAKTIISLLSKDLRRIGGRYASYRATAIVALIALARFLPLLSGGVVAAEGAVSREICVSVPHFRDEYWFSVAYGFGQEARRHDGALLFFEYRSRPYQIARSGAAWRVGLTPSCWGCRRRSLRFTGGHKGCIAAGARLWPDERVAQ